jgi:hypothetical protein
MNRLPLVSLVWRLLRPSRWGCSVGQEPSLIFDTLSRIRKIWFHMTQ